MAADALFTVLLARGFLSNCWTFSAIRRLCAPGSRDSCLDSDKLLLIVLPVFQESELIQSIIKHLQTLIEATPNIRIIVVGTARERDGQENPTLTAALFAIGSDDRFVILEDPRRDSRMAHQINYAAMHCAEVGIDPAKAWLYLLNIDSRLTRSGLEEILCAINHDNQIIHQSAVFLRGFGKLNCLCRGFALWQSRWTISHELKRFTFHNRCSYWLMHTVGHGLCISLRLFLAYKMLPEHSPTEDLHFGFYLAAAGERVTVIRSLEIGDSPTTFASAMRQKYAWAHGPMHYVSYLNHYKRRFPDLWRATRWRARVIAFQGMLSWVDWMTVSWILILSIYAMAQRSVLAAAFFGIYFLDYFQTEIYFYRSGMIAGSQVVPAFLATVICGAFHSAPANLAFLHALANRPMRPYKTPHDSNIDGW